MDQTGRDGVKKSTAWRLSRMGPEAFQMVDLRDPDTFSNATISEWLEERARVEKKLGPPETRSERWREEIKLQEAAGRILRDEEEQNGTPVGSVLTPRQRRRRHAIYRRLVKESQFPGYMLTQWEHEFKRASQWLDVLERHLHTTGDPTAALVRQLWQRSVRAEQGLARERAEERERRRKSLAFAGGIGSPRNRSPYLPRPIPLMQIYRLTILMLHPLIEGFANFHTLNLKPNRYGAAFPCPNCRTKHEEAWRAEACCETPYSPEESALYHATVVPGGRAHEDTVWKFLKEVHSFGYPTAASLDDAMNWEGWERLKEKNLRGSAESFLALIYGAPPGTVRRSLSNSRLSKEYEKHRIRKRDRVFRKGPAALHAAAMKPAGWFERAEPQVERSLFDLPYKVINEWPCGRGA